MFADFERGGALVILGGGFIGLEAAAVAFEGPDSLEEVVLADGIRLVVHVVQGAAKHNQIIGAVLKRDIEDRLISDRDRHVTGRRATPQMRSTSMSGKSPWISNTAVVFASNCSGQPRYCPRVSAIVALGRGLPVSRSRRSPVGPPRGRCRRSRWRQRAGRDTRSG
jgi:hypothetical protein